ncbi:MAG: hypothetical protein IKK94_05590 [Clostridia bacterium]|nr:hypothetical protein [Clostridia bacterium]
MQGKKTPPEVIYKIMTSWVVTNNYKETARALDLPYMTVKNIVDTNKDKPEFVKLRNEKIKEFSSRASEIIQKGLTLLNKRFDRAIASEDDLDVLIDEIFASDKEELSQDEKNKLVAKIRVLQLLDIKAITTAIGTLYDKKALSEGAATENVSFEIKLPPGADEYAG